MICPICKANNAPGKRICVKCGGPLSSGKPGPGSRQAPNYAAKYGATEETKKKGRSKAILLIILLLGLTYIIYMGTAVPEAVNPGQYKFSKKESNKADLIFSNLAFYGKNNRKITKIVNVAELNFFIQENYNLVKKHTRQGSISVDNLYINLSSGNISLIFKTRVKYKDIYICMAGKPVKKGNYLKLTIDEISIGKLRLPLETGPFIAKFIKPKGNPLAFELPAYVRDIEFEHDTMTITIGPERQK